MAERFEDKRINEALDLLNEVAKEKAAELQARISDKYGNLKAALGEAGESLGQQAHKTYTRGKERAQGAAAEAGENVHANAWLYLGGTAIGCLLLGFLLGKSKN